MKKIIPVFTSPALAKKRDHQLEAMVQESVDSTVQEDSHGRIEKEEFSLEEIKRSPMTDISNDPMMAKKSSAPVQASGSKKMFDLLTPWMREKPSAKTGKRKSKKDPPIEAKKSNSSGWRRNYGLLSVLEASRAAMEEQKLSFAQLRFSTMVYDQLIDNGTITIENLDSKKKADKANELKSRITTILSSFSRTMNLPQNVCPPEDHKDVESCLVQILELDREYEGNTRCNVQQFKESKTGNIMSLTIKG